MDARDFERMMSSDCWRLNSLIALEPHILLNPMEMATYTIDHIKHHNLAQKFLMW
jgi:hypothetical protein